MITQPLLDKLSGIEYGAEINDVNSVNGKTGAITLSQDDIIDGSLYVRMTPAEKSKLGNLTDNFKGLFANSTARDLAITSPQNGNYVIQEDTDSIWYYSNTWIDTGTTSTGDMSKVVYDPQNINGDSFNRNNHTGTQLANTISDFNTQVSNNTDVTNSFKKNTDTLDDIQDGVTYVKTTNDFTDTEKSKLAGVEPNATGDQTANEILALIKTVDDPVRGGTIPHQGKKPYLRAEVGMINANLQNGRGGAETTSFDIIDPEIKELLVLKNPMTPAARQIRGLDYSVGFNKYFAKKAANNEDWVLFSYADVPDLYEAMYATDDTFERLYEDYVKQGKGRETVKARDVLRLMLTEGVGVGRIYQENLFEMNYHTPFKTDGNGKIRQSNLCLEISLITNAYDSVKDLYVYGDLKKAVVDNAHPSVIQYLKEKNEAVKGEVAVCSLAGINVGKIKGKVS